MGPLLWRDWPHDISHQLARGIVYRTINYIRLLERKYPQIKVADLLDHASMTPYEVADEGHWFTQDQVDRFYERLSFLTSNPSLAREAGRYAASPDAMGAKKWLDYDRCMILLADRSGKRLVFGPGYGHDERQLKLLRKTAFHLDRSVSRGIFFVGCFKQQQSF
jgi:hypothetical protein